MIKRNCVCVCGFIVGQEWISRSLALEIVFVFMAMGLAIGKFCLIPKEIFS